MFDVPPICNRMLQRGLTYTHVIYGRSLSSYDRQERNPILLRLDFVVGLSKYVRHTCGE